MQIEQHFREILRLHAFVAIPGVGSLCRAYIPARIDAKSNTIHPPFYQFTFDSARTFDDGAIVGYLKSSYGADTQQAERTVREWLSTLEARMAIGEPIVFDGVGTLAAQEGAILFSPLATEKTATNFYGLTPVALPVALKNAKGRGNKKKRTSAVLIPIFLLLLGGGGYAAYRFLDWPYILSLTPWNKKTPPQIASTPSPRSDTTIAITTPPVAVDSVVPQTAAPSTLNIVDSSLQQRNALQPSEANTVYYIVAGSFKSKENAQKQVDDLLQMGFINPKIKQEKDFFQVYIAYYTDQKQALTKLKELWNKHGEDFCFLNKVEK